MKKALITSLLTFLSVANLYSQKSSLNLPTDDSTGKITYSEVVTLNDSPTKAELFSRSKFSEMQKK